jgi:hypothetical protein
MLRFLRILQSRLRVQWAMMRDDQVEVCANCLTSASQSPAMIALTKGSCPRCGGTRAIDAVEFSLADVANGARDDDDAIS